MKALGRHPVEPVAAHLEAAAAIAEYKALPLQAKCALEYFDTKSSSERSHACLDALLDHYHQAYGMTCGDVHRTWCHLYVSWRYDMAPSETPGPHR